MAQWRALDETMTVRAARTLLSAEPWLMSAVVPQAAADLGWQVTDFDQEWADLGAFLDTGLGLGPMSGFFRTDEQSRVESVSMNLTEKAVGDKPAIEAFKQDAFAAAAAALTGEFGRPTDPLPGEEPQLWWRRPDTAFGLITKDDAVGIQLTPNQLMTGPWK